MLARKYSWRPEIPDHRDHTFSLTAPSLPKYIAPLGSSNIVVDQGHLGSCTGNAVTTALEISLNTQETYSRLMTYYNGRMIEGTVEYDAGAQIRDVIKGVQMYGISTETKWPYDISKFAEHPSNDAYANAMTLLPKIGSYQRLNTLMDVKVAIAHKLPVIFGFAVPDYFESPGVARDAWVNFPKSTTNIIGGHAVCAVGYDERGGVPFMWARNSWGKNWGIGGDFKMPYTWFTDPSKLVDDMWVIHPKV
jgi:C1A family cysteine protease